MKGIFVFISAVIAGLSPATATAQSTPAAAMTKEFPVKGRPITILVGLSAGGGVDLGARLMAAGLEKELGTPVQVVNKPGASHQVAMTELVRSKPDGYTLGVTTFLTVLVTYLDPERKAAYGRSSSQPVAHYNLERNVLVVKSDSPYKSVKDLVDAAKLNPGKVKAATSGLMTNTHLPMLMLERLSGAKFAYVHFSGAAPALNAVLGGHADAFVSSAAASRQHLKSGALRGLGISDKQESEFFPDIKTLEAQGFKVHAPFSNGISAPAGTPKDVVDILSRAIKRVLDSADIQDKMRNMAMTSAYMDPEQFARYWAEMEAQVEPLIKLAKDTK